MTTTPDNAIRNRVQELRTVRAGDLLADERNWRRHPTAQRQALQSMLERIGYADAVIARETDAGLMLIDGHLRADLDPNAELPVLVVDLDDDEAGQLLASLDPLSAMAEADADALADLLETIVDLPPIDYGKLYAEYEPPIAADEVAWPEREQQDHPLGIMRFIVSEAQRETVEEALSLAKRLNNVDDDPDNENSNGNALAGICAAWIAQNQSA